MRPRDPLPSTLELFAGAVAFVLLFGSLLVFLAAFTPTPR